MTVILSGAAPWLGTANQHRGSSLRANVGKLQPPFDDSLSGVVTSGSKMSSWLTEILFFFLSFFIPRSFILTTNGRLAAKQFYFTR